MLELKTMVMLTLKNQPETRNCDIKLTQAIWRGYYPEYVINGNIDIDNLGKLPLMSHIQRYRRLFNEYGQYLPTKEKQRDRQAQTAYWKSKIRFTK